MTLMHMSLQEFQPEVDKIVRQMIEAKLIPGMSLDNKSAISALAEKVAKTLEKADVQIFKNELDDKNTREAIGLACQAEAAHQHNPNFKFDYTLLFKDQSKMTPEQKLKFKKDLKTELTKLFTEMSKFYPHPAPGAKQKLEELAGIIADKFTTEDHVKDNNTLSALISGCLRQLQLNENLLAKQEAEQRREFYGVDTHVTGKTFLPMPPPPQGGNQSGLLDMAFQDGDSFMAELKCANPDEPDPIGIKMANIIADIGSGLLSSGLESKLLQDNLLPTEPSAQSSNWPPKLVPSGYKGPGE